MQAIELDLARIGCAAASYRLTGEGIDQLCCVRVDGISGNWRIIVGFPEPREVAIVAIGQHDPRRGLDTYQVLYGIVGLPAPAGRRSKPPCCIDGEPPVDSALLDRLEAAARRLR